MKDYETWAAKNDELFLYTENPLVAKTLRKIFGRLTTYEKDLRVFGWQCCVPTEKVGFVEMQIRKGLGILRKCYAP